MPRFGPFIHQVYIADGFAADCDELVHRCLNMETFNFHVFCAIWRDLKMGCVYEGRTLGAEIAELSEELIHVGKHYMLKDTSNFEESAIGVFIVYALLNLQPFKGFAHLRIVPEDLPAINRIDYVARRDKRYDVLYALGSILIRGPVEYHAAEREYGMDLAVRKYLEGFTSVEILGVRPKGVFRRQNEELDLIHELDIITQKYTQAKKAISEKAQFDRNLQYVSPHLGSDLAFSLRRLISGIHNEQCEGSRDDGEKLATSRRAIKEKAMHEDVKPVRHRVNLKDKNTSTVTSTVTSGSLKRGKGIGRSSKKEAKIKIKEENSSTKMLYRKRRIPISPRALKRCRYISDPDDDEVSALEHDKSDTNEDDEQSNDAYDDDIESIALSERKKAATVDSKETKTLQKPVKDIEKKDKESEPDRNIAINNLPIVMRNENPEQLFEVVIIDEEDPTVQSNNCKNTEKPPFKTYKKVSTLKNVTSMPGVTIKTEVDSKVTEKIDSSTNDLDKVIGVKSKKGKKDETGKSAKGKQILGIASSKIEKRDCKRVHIQSKFKRLGMLPIANFKAPEVLASIETNEDESSKGDTQEDAGLAPIEL